LGSVSAMTAIGGKHRKPKLPSQPQIVIQWAPDAKRYAKLDVDEKQFAIIAWVGDPNAATKFNSKFEAKSRTRDMADIPDSRVFRVMEVNEHGLL
jgi:hypothetical protein